MHPVRKLSQRVGLNYLPPILRRTVVGVVGATILLIGVLLMVLPGPGILVILIGLAVLGSEFVWARRMIRRARVLGRQGHAYIKSVVFKS
ncbi:MAG TPA: PGPGW domain-containing protein [Chthoniobacterales bacterium]|nr:PGPGW domain-containing protein [Chthoniobacterales bacterium]